MCGFMKPGRKVAKGDRMVLRDCKSRRAVVPKSRAAPRNLQFRGTIISLAARTTHTIKP